jgi:hypothetical protein
MKRPVLLVTFSFIIFAFFSINLFAQRGGMNKRGAGWGAGNQYNRMYNISTVQTITGEVVKVDKIIPIKGMSYGVHLLLKTDKDTVSVHVGPAWFVDNLKTKITLNDKVIVTGSKIIFQDSPTIIASEIKKGDKTIILRDKNGYPVWSGSGRR